MGETDWKKSQLDIQLNSTQLYSDNSDWMVMVRRNLRLTPALIIVAQWMCDAWDSISTDMVVKSFKKCDISNAMNDTEDDIIYKHFMSQKLDTEDTVCDNWMIYTTTFLCPICRGNCCLKTIVLILILLDSRKKTCKINPSTILWISLYWCVHAQHNTYHWLLSCWQSC